MQAFKGLTLDLLLKIFMPLLTFALGVFTTRLLKKREAKDDFLREHVANLVSLASDWYNQLVDLRGTSLDPDVTPAKLDWELYRYLNKRTVLPKMKLSLEVLKNSGRYPELVATAERFLLIVTIPDGTLSDVVVDLPPIALAGTRKNPMPTRSRQDHLSSLSCLIQQSVNPRAAENLALDGALRSLDCLVQRMVKIAADALSKSRLALMAVPPSRITASECLDHLSRKNRR